MARITGQNIVTTFGDLEQVNDAALALSRGGVDADGVSILGREQARASGSARSTPAA